MSILNRAFLVATAERAVKTFAQALAAIFVAGVTVLNIAWPEALAVAGTAALLSVLTSIASGHLGKWEGPSLADETLVTSGIVFVPEDDDA